MINLNKYNFKAGDSVILDRDFNNSSVVTIVEVSNIYAVVESDGNIWTTMVSRLSPKTEN